MKMENKKGFKQNPSDIFDTEMRFKAIEEGAKKHEAKMADEKRLGIPSYDESVISDYLKNRTEPPKDMVSGRNIFRVEAIKQPESEYEIELKKLRTFSANELEKLLKEVETKSKEGKGLFSSKGSLLDGYAIDPITLNCLQSKYHEGLAEDLAIEIMSRMDVDSMGESTESILRRRIMTGLVFNEVSGFKIPIIKFNGFGLKGIGDVIPEESIQRVVNYIKEEKNCYLLVYVFNCFSCFFIISNSLE